MKTRLITGILILTLSFSQKSYSQCEDLIWSDEFNGNSLDETKWSYQRGGWNGAQVQNCYVDDNTSVSDGSLKINSKYEPGYDCFNGAKDFTSGFVQTKNRISWTYGIFKARVKVPASNSTWPAFWMSPQSGVYGSWPQSGEIDIFEIKGHDLSKSYGNAHWGNSANDKQQEKGTYTFSPGDDASNWHVYAVEWNLGELKFYIDGEHYHTINNFDEPNATTHPGPFNIDFYLRLNVAVGGNYLVAPWNDANNGIDQLPATMEVDWVRVYEKNNNCDPDPNNPDPNPVCELITNGNFNDGTNNWSLYKSGTEGTLQIEPNGYLKIDVITTGSSDWKLALRQNDINLEQGKTYEIRYDAYADANRTGNLIMSKSGGAQYAYISQNYTTSPTTYSHQFTMNETTDNAAIFNLNVGATLVDVHVKNISLSEVDCVPACQNPNIISNPSFENDFTDWDYRTAANTSANFTSMNNSEVDGNKVAQVQVNTVAQNYWDIQLKRSNLNYDLNESYELSFAIKSNQSNLQFSYGSNQTASNTYIFSGAGITSTEWQTVRKIFTANSAQPAYFVLNFGYNTGTFYVDNIQFRKVCEEDNEPEPPVCNLVVTNINDAGPGSLKEVIACAPDGATIIISDVLADYSIFIQDASITIDKNLTIESNVDFPTFLNATNVQRVFEVEPNANLTITNVHLVGGQANTGNVMVNEGMVTLQGVEVFNCIINPFPENPRLGGNGNYQLLPDVVIHK